MTVTRIGTPPPDVMQPQETLSIAGDMGTDIPATWNPIQSGWDNDRYIDSSSMYDIPAMTGSTVVDSQTHAPVDTPMTSSSITDYGIRIGASGLATLSSSTTVFTAWEMSTYTLASHVYTTSYPVVTTEVTLVPIPAQSAMTIGVSPKPSQRNVGAIVAITVAPAVLLLLALAAFIIVRQWKHWQKFCNESFFLERSPISTWQESGIDSERKYSVRMSVHSQLSTPDGDQLDELEHSGPQLQVESTLST
ncbi:hypothetical protein DFH07DRAFT_956829 [Mycena maculata]|uniref:Uncharacterized protein n=1 Tax=Mycena maculata TaxID=230809 RepID=A0AAD7JFM9_9AGAR|nr:hypothetical protein DFH07DRAFT_956829 [Mycena maculata]